MFIENHSTVLFQGDSITDAMRVREDAQDLGLGYPRYAASLFSALHPEMDVTFLNRGVSGNTTTHLIDRWTEDCIRLAPDVLSILIGINDCWRRFDSDQITPVERYRDNYELLLSRVKKELPNTKIIMMEPFLLPYPQDRIAWREDLDPKIHAMRELALSYADVFIPCDGIMNRAYQTKKGEHTWSADGVHPTPEGHALLAIEWLKAVGAM